MANKTINELSPVTLSSTSEFAVYQNGSTGKATMSQVLSNTLYADGETSIKTIKSYLTDDTIYPITKASAVYMEGSTDTVESKITQLEENKLEKIGGTITGNLYFKNSYTNATNIDTVNDHLQTLYFTDQNDVIMGYQQFGTQHSNGAIENAFFARKIVNNENLNHGFRLGIDSSNNRYVSFSEVAPWLTGLGLNVTSTAMGTLTASTSSGDTAGIYLYKQNNFCSIRINQIRPTQNSTQTFATIPSGFRPKHAYYIPCVSPTNIFVTVNTNGSLSLNLATTSNLYATGVFMLS